MKQGIVIDPAKFIIEKTGWYDPTRIDGLYLKFDGQLIPAAYIFPIENQTAVQQLLNELKAR